MINYLARHGETTGDIENRYGGDYDDHLTDRGRQQSEILAAQLGTKQIEKLYASPLARAQETATMVAKQAGLEIEILPTFKERNGYGILTGLTKDEAAQKHPDQVEILKDVHAAVQGAEEYPDFQRRITDALDDVSSQDFETIAVVTHGGPIRLIFRDILQLGEIGVSDCAYAIIEAVDGTYKLLDMSGISIKS